MTPILDTARPAYAVGLCLLPTRDDGSKAPDVSSWTDFKTTRPTVEQMRAFNFAQRSGIGMIAGAVSGYRECWDFDAEDVFQAFVEAARACGLEDVVQRIRAGYEDETPGGGRRWIVTYPASISWGSCKLARRPGRDGEPDVKTLIELPTHAILAPSNGATHPSGRPYIHVSGGFGTIASYTVTERTDLLELARSFDRMPRAEVRPRGASAVKDGTRPGDHYNQRTTWPVLLEAAGWTHVFGRGDVEYWRRPGKVQGISATTNYGGADLLYVFSSSTPFAPDKSYNRFAAFAVLEHGGDFAQAARVLADQGYGQPLKGHVRELHRPANPTPATRASWRWLADVQREYPEWLWRSRLARGTLALWIGDGGLGKSRASNDVAARVTVGAPWPDGESAPLGNTIILSAEDSASYTIRPAIEAAGGDLRRVAILDAIHDASGAERTFNLSTDLAALEHVLTATDASLIIIDPLSAYFGTALDSYRDTDVRSVLEPVCKLAERRHVAVLGIMHIGKGGDRQARHRALGSVAFVNAARLVFAIGPDPDDDTRRLLMPVKANLCREAPTLAFRLDDANGVARVVWESAPVTGMTADAVLNSKPKAADADEQDATSVLHTLLEDEEWPLEAKTALDAGRAQGIPERTMRRAARGVGIQIRRLGFGRSGRWLWHRPTAGVTDASTTSDEPGADHNQDAPNPEAVKGASVGPVAPMTRVAPMVGPKGPVARMAPLQEQQQNTHRSIAAGSMSTRAREATAASDDLPTCLQELAAPDTADPIGAHDEADEEPWER